MGRPRSCEAGGQGLAAPTRRDLDAARPKIVELQVHPERRGTGVGTRLLEHVFGLVGSQPLSLTTRTDNPARRLYERHGFVVTEEKTSRYFERRTGAKGRVLMVRPPSSAK